MYVKAEPTTDVNRNTEWFTYPGVWTTYMLIVFMSWLLVLSIFGCSPGMAWTIVHFCHFAVSKKTRHLLYVRIRSEDLDNLCSMIEEE
ncbi:hypothetical protein NC651_037715 [Populus alba x Populus x berolinensis]|nr:hypothetical protein NC651_037715 [Populus alba x Populus x berolinensis]